MDKVNNDIYEAYGDRWYTAQDDPVALLRAESKTKTPWVISQIEARFPLTEATRVLDIGCGRGQLCRIVKVLGAASVMVARDRRRAVGRLSIGLGIGGIAAAGSTIVMARWGATFGSAVAQRRSVSF